MNAANKAWRRANPERESRNKAARRVRFRQTDPLRYFAKTLRNSAKSRSKILGVPFDLDEDWIYERLAAGRCEATLAPFVMQAKNPFVPSLDQIMPQGGYTKANVQVVAWIYNAAKQQWGHDAVLQLAQALTSPRHPTALVA